MKLLALILSAFAASSAWAGYQTGTFNCAMSDSSLSGTFTISMSGSLPYLEATISGSKRATITVQGLATVETEPTVTLVGIPSLDTDGFYTIEFGSNGTISVGSMTCTAAAATSRLH